MGVAKGLPCSLYSMTHLSSTCVYVDCVRGALNCSVVL